MKRGMIEVARFGVTINAVRIDGGHPIIVGPLIPFTRLECPACGSSWPMDAPELECSCPPNADEVSR